MKEHLEIYNKIAKKYDEEYSNDLSDTIYIDSFLKRVTENGVLDIGCGIGILSKYIADKGYNVDGIE